MLLRSFYYFALFAKLSTLLWSINMDVTLIAAVITAVVTILVALAGYLITYWNNILISRRTEQLNRINKREFCVSQVD